MVPVVIYLSTTPSQISTIGITSSGNTLTVNGKTANAVNSVSGNMDGNNLNISVNGIAGQVALPSTEGHIIDPDNMPTDFVNGEYITVYFKQQFVYNHGSYNMADKGFINKFIVQIGKTYYNLSDSSSVVPAVFNPANINQFYNIQWFGVRSVSDASIWNAPTGRGLFNIGRFYLNISGLRYEAIGDMSEYILYEEIKDYVYKIVRGVI